MAGKFLFSGSLKGFNEYDEILGWVPTPNFTKKTVLKDFSGTSYECSYRSYDNGARLWGSRPGAASVLFLGDSYTQARDVSNGKTYYDLFALRTGLDTYAIGSDGYGTLQEDLLAKRMFGDGKPRPHILVLQFCDNDFVNNSIDLEQDFVVFHQRLRPYLKDGRIVYDLKSNKLFMFFYGHSYLFRFLVGRFEIMLFKANRGYSFGRLDKARMHAYYGESRAVTGEILRDLRRSFPDTRMYAFNMSEPGKEEFVGDSFRRVMSENGFTALEGARDYIVAGDGTGGNVFAADGAHLNERGNRLLADFLASRICAGVACPAAKAPAIGYGNK